MLSGDLKTNEFDFTFIIIYPLLHNSKLFDWPFERFRRNPLFKNYKKILIGFVVLLLLGGVGWFALFEYGVRRLKTEVTRGINDLKQQGYDVSYSNLEFRGHPLSITAIIQNPHLRDPSGVFDWSAQEATIRMKPWAWHTFSISFPHEQKIASRLFPTVAFVSLEGTRGILTLNRQGRLEEASFVIDRLHFPNTKLHPLFLQALSLKLNNVSHLLDLHLSLSAAMGGLETVLKGSRPPQPVTLSVEATLSGFQRATLPHSLAEWRDGGGVLNVKLAKLSWPSVMVTGEGTLTFDQDMYPLGSFSARVVGHRDILTLLGEAGYVKKKNATMVGFALDIMSHVDDKGNKQLTVPITLQDRKISVSAIPLWKME